DHPRQARRHGDPERRHPLDRPEGDPRREDHDDDRRRTRGLAGSGPGRAMMVSMAPFSLTPRNREIRDNFDAIAPRYDLTNRVISLGIDLHWRRVAVRQLRDLPPGALVLDLACGTCDLALEVLRQRPGARVVGADLSRTMLGLARKEIAGPRGRAAAGARAAGAQAGAGARLTLVNAPAEALPFRDGSFDAATIGFGIRN